jgi:hypothetical protein
MSVSYYANSIIGLKVSRNKAVERATVKAFTHDYPTDWIKDPKTGRDLWRTEDQLLDGFTGEIWDDNVRFAGNYLVIVEPHPHDRWRAGDVFIAMHHCVSNNYDSKAKMMAQLNLATIQSDFETFKSACERHGLWDPANFGLWSYLHISG